MTGKRSPGFWRFRIRGRSRRAQTLLELAEDFAPVYQRLERLRRRDDPAALTAKFAHDADNASVSVVKELLEEVAKYGTATVKRAYGDWTTSNLVEWKEHLHRHAFQPMQRLADTKGKNSTDSAFIIDAMDVLYAGNLDGFCLVSSDSDFTRLATRGQRRVVEVGMPGFDRQLAGDQG